MEQPFRLFDRDDDSMRHGMILSVIQTKEEEEDEVKKVGPLGKAEEEKIKDILKVDLISDTNGGRGCPRIFWGVNNLVAEV